MRELSLHILDIVQNSLEAGATHITIEIDEDLAEDRLTIRVMDNAGAWTRRPCGVSPTPFSRRAKPAGWDWGFRC